MVLVIKSNTKEHLHQRGALNVVSKLLGILVLLLHQITQVSSVRGASQSTALASLGLSCFYILNACPTSMLCCDHRLTECRLFAR